MNKKNTWGAKLMRTFTSVLPVAKNRKGSCVSCGDCCKLPNVCPFLTFNAENKSMCTAYAVRPLNCRKYPRTKKEWITEGKCGYKFE